MSMRMRRNPKGQRTWCVQCHAPLPNHFGTALGFDTEWLLCSDCNPPVTEVPRVTLYGAPEGQELARWSDDLRSTQVDTSQPVDATRVEIDIDALGGPGDVW